MADKAPVKKTKRLVKNPETFRERALKASEATDKPSNRLRLTSVGGKVIRPVVSPLGKLLRALGRLKPFRLIGRILFPTYLRQSWRELRLVTWPSRKESFRLTFAVLLFAIIFGGLVAAVDFGLDKLFKQILLK